MSMRLLETVKKWAEQQKISSRRVTRIIHSHESTFPYVSVRGRLMASKLLMAMAVGGFGTNNRYSATEEQQYFEGMAHVAQEFKVASLLPASPLIQLADVYIAAFLVLQDINGILTTANGQKPIYPTVRALFTWWQTHQKRQGQPVPFAATPQEMAEMFCRAAEIPTCCYCGQFYVDYHLCPVSHPYIEHFQSQVISTASPISNELRTVFQVAPRVGMVMTLLDLYDMASRAMSFREELYRLADHLYNGMVAYEQSLLAPWHVPLCKTCFHYHRLEDGCFPLYVDRVTYLESVAHLLEVALHVAPTEETVFVLTCQVLGRYGHYSEQLVVMDALADMTRTWGTHNREIERGVGLLTTVVYPQVLENLALWREANSETETTADLLKSTLRETALAELYTFLREIAKRDEYGLAVLHRFKETIETHLLASLNMLHPTARRRNHKVNVRILDEIRSTARRIIEVFFDSVLTSIEVLGYAPAKARYFGEVLRIGIGLLGFTESLGFYKTLEEIAQKSNTKRFAPEITVILRVRIAEIESALLYHHHREQLVEQVTLGGMGIIPERIVKAYSNPLLFNAYEDAWVVPLRLYPPQSDVGLVCVRYDERTKRPKALDIITLPPMKTIQKKVGIVSASFLATLAPHEYDAVVRYATKAPSTKITLKSRSIRLAQLLRELHGMSSDNDLLVDAVGQVLSESPSYGACMTTLDKRWFIIAVEDKEIGGIRLVWYRWESFTSLYVHSHKTATSRWEACLKIVRRVLCGDPVYGVIVPHFGVSLVGQTWKHPLLPNTKSLASAG